MTTPLTSNDTDQSLIGSLSPLLKNLKKSHLRHVNGVKTGPKNLIQSDIKELEREYAPVKENLKIRLQSTTDDDVLDTDPSSENVKEDLKSLNPIEELVGRERIKRHRVEVAGRVWIPESWGQEELLKDWTDCSGFEASLMNSTVMSARAALIEEGRRRANSGSLRMERTY